ncbi:MAG TPA: hypothetical protein VFZ76_09915 [Anaerolineales bacterium]
MSVSVTTLESDRSESIDWLRSRDWDLTWITLSVVLVATPYLAYLGLLSLESVIEPMAEYFGASVDSLSRNIVNAGVALLVGGPHMYATFTRTALDRKFTRQHRKLMWSSLIIPIIVITLAMLNLPLLLTLFFFWASIHVLHQIIYIIELYNHKQKSALSRFSRLADYGVVLTALYPLAAWKIANGTFLIGENDLSSVIAAVIPVGSWMVWLAGGAFALALLAWSAKSMLEYQQGAIHWPKTVFIALTVIAAFFVPALGNLDTAFQGMNVWHSLQYLALTWMLNHLRQKRGELDSSPFVERLSTDGTARRYYLFNVGLTIADVALAGLIFAVLMYVFNFPFDYAFDRAYYIAVLSFLWIHYYHDHFLFSQPGVIDG